MSNSYIDAIKSITELPLNEVASSHRKSLLSLGRDIIKEVNSRIPSVIMKFQTIPSSVGVSTQFARADHTHSPITYNTISKQVVIPGDHGMVIAGAMTIDTDGILIISDNATVIIL